MQSAASYLRQFVHGCTPLWVCGKDRVAREFLEGLVSEKDKDPSLMPWGPRRQQCWCSEQKKGIVRHSQTR